jgi:hypothetical protein
MVTGRRAGDTPAASLPKTGFFWASQEEKEWEWGLTFYFFFVI